MIKYFLMKVLVVAAAFPELLGGGAKRSFEVELISKFYILDV